MKNRFVIFLLFLSFCHPSFAVQTVMNGSAVRDSLGIFAESHAVIVTDSIQHRNYQNPGDALWFMPGIRIRDLGTAGQWMEPSIHGSTTGQVDILWDGLLMNDPWTGRPDITLIPADGSDQMASLSGLNPLSRPNPGGTLQFQYLGLKTNRPCTRVHYQSAGDHFSNIDVVFSQQMTKRWQIASGVQLLQYGSSDINESSNRKLHQGQTVFSILTFQMSENWQWAYHILSNKNRSNLPYSVPSVLDTIIIDSPRLKRERTDQALSLAGTWHFVHNNVLVQHTSDETRLTNRQDNSETPLKTSMVRLHWDAAIRYRIPIQAGVDFYSSSYSARDTSTTQKWNDSAFHGWLAVTYPVISKLALSAKVIFDKVKAYDPKTLFLSEVQYNLLKQAKLTFAFSTVRRVPTPAEKFGLSCYPVPPTFFEETIFYENSLPVLPNPDLKAETGHRSELRFHWNRQKFLISLCGYHRSVHDIIVPGMTYDGISYLNHADHRFIGFDAGIQLPLWNTLRLETVFSCLKAEDKAGSSLPERPYTWGNSAIYWSSRFFENDLQTKLTLAIRYWSDCHTLATPYSYSASQIYAYQPAGYALDAKLVLIFLQYGAMGLSFDNILNRQIYLADKLTLRGRVYRFDFSWELFD